MEFSTLLASPAKVKAGCLLVGIFEDGQLSDAAAELDLASKGAIRAVLSSGDITGKSAQTLVLRTLPGIAANRLVLVGLGKASEFNSQALQQAVQAGVKAASSSATIDLAIALLDIPIQSLTGQTIDTRTRARLISLHAQNTLYQYKAPVKRVEKNKQKQLSKLILLTDRSTSKAAEIGCQEGNAIAHGLGITKDLGNLPGNICTPNYLAEQAKKLGRDWKLKVEVLERKQIENLKMGSFLAVAQGSEQAAKFIIIHYDGTKNSRASEVKPSPNKNNAIKSKSPIVLVGKGITFDSGGISIKPAGAMDEMRYDMCGAATVIGTLRSIAEMKLALHVIGVIPTCENMPSGRAIKPGDVVTSMSGQTIEILNTDAEGRLILCDALTYSSRFKPALVIDIATLTGACVTALGHINSGLFSTDETLAQELTQAAQQSGDKVWRLPLDEEYKEQLKSNFADLANIGGPPAGAVTAACFLSHFTQSYPWAHLDIAGTAWKSGKDKGATGRPVPLLTQFLIDQADKK